MNPQISVTWALSLLPNKLRNLSFCILWQHISVSWLSCERGYRWPSALSAANESHKGTLGSYAQSTFRALSPCLITQPISNNLTVWAASTVKTIFFLNIKADRLFTVSC